MSFVQSLVPKKMDDNDNIVNFHIDINKCRKNILYYSKYDYPVFTVMDKPEVYRVKFLLSKVTRLSKKDASRSRK